MLGVGSRGTPTPGFGAKPARPTYGDSGQRRPAENLKSTSVSGRIATLPVRVFLSYTHDSETHGDRVLALAERLRDEGIDATVDRYVRGTPVEGWPAWMEDQVRRADFVLIICTEAYYRRYSRNERPGIGLGARWESNLVRDELYGNPEGLRKYIPVLAPQAVVDDIPEPLRYAATRYHLSSDYDALYRHLTGQPEVRLPPLGPRRIMPGPQRQIEASDSDCFSEPIRARFAEIGRTIAALTEEQHRVIQELHGQRRALICGCAGSGKTLVAAEKAMRLSHAGLTTVFVCHNPRLAEWVATLTEGSAVKVTAFEDLIAHLAGGASSLRKDWTNYSQPTRKTLDDARAELLRNPPRLDAIVVDEGQDFEPAWWDVLAAALADAQTGILYIFFDDQQALLPYRSAYPVRSAAHDLSRNCRNAGQVYDIMRKLVSGSPPPDEALATQGEAIFTHRGPGQLESALVECLEWLHGKDAVDDTVAVLGGRVSFEHSILARRSFVVGSRFDWREAIASEVDRIVTSPDGSVALAGGYRAIKRALRSLGDGPIPSRADVDLVRRAASHLTSVPVPTPKDVRWGEPEVRPADDARTAPRLMTARGPRLLRQAEVVSALRTGSWANAVPKPAVVTFAPHASALQPAIPVYGVGEIKGLEREVVLMVMQGDAPELLHELYVGVSRARVLLAAALDERVFAALPTSLKELAQGLDKSAMDKSTSKDAAAGTRKARPRPPSRSMLARKTKRRN